MTDPHAIARDLRRRTADVGWCDHDGVIKAMRRGAAEIERLADELIYLRGFAADRLAAERADVEDAA